MPSDDYTAFSGGGALKLKGGKVSKSKGKKKKDKTAAELERALSTGDSADNNSSRDVEKAAGENKKHRKDPQDEDERPAQEEEEDDGDEPVEYKTEAQKRHEEYKRKKVSPLCPREERPLLTLIWYRCWSWRSPRARGRSCSRRTRRGSRSSTRICPSSASTTTCPRSVRAR